MTSSLMIILDFIACYSLFYMHYHRSVYSYIQQVVLSEDHFCVSHGCPEPGHSISSLDHCGGVCSEFCSWWGCISLDFCISWGRIFEDCIFVYLTHHMYMIVEDCTFCLFRHISCIWSLYIDIHDSAFVIRVLILILFICDRFSYYFVVLQSIQIKSFIF